MEKKTNDTDSAAWVDQKMDSLQPDSIWNPDAAKAFQRFTEFQVRKERGTGMQTLGRMAMAATITILIGLVVITLPWKRLTESPGESNPTPVEQSAPQNQTPVQPQPSTEDSSGKSVPPPQTQSPATLPVQSPKTSEENIVPVTTQKSEDAGPGNSRPWDTAPKCNRLEPDYTDQARAARIQGTIILDAAFHTDGTVTVEKIITGLGYGLDENAIRTVQSWMCTPAIKDGNPVETTTRITMNFRLY